MRLCEEVLGEVDQHRTEIMMLPKGYISRFLIDAPFFLEQSILVLDGEVRI
jgi:hypothetical protein